MEFYTRVQNKNIDAQSLYELLTIESLTEYCPSVDKIISIQSDNRGGVYTGWGQFEVSREKIRNGVRFSLLNCPHALAWTITVNSIIDAIVIHCTIDKEEADSEFVESIQQFVADWAVSLSKKFNVVIRQD